MHWQYLELAVPPFGLLVKQEMKSVLQICVFWAWWDSVNCLTSVFVCTCHRQSRSFLPSWGFLLALLPLIRPKRKAKKKKPLKHRSDETPLSCTRTVWTEERRGRHLSGTGVCVGGTWASNVIARLECMVRCMEVRLYHTASISCHSYTRVIIKPRLKKWSVEN